MLLTGRNANLILPQYTMYSQEVKKLEIDRKYSNILFVITSIVISLSEWNIQSIIGYFSWWVLTDCATSSLKESSIVCCWGIWNMEHLNKEGPKGGVEGGGEPIPFPSPFFFPNRNSQCSNSIPTSKIKTKSQCYTYQLFSLCIRKITASKYDQEIMIISWYDPTKTQKFTRICEDILKTIGSF